MPVLHNHDVRYVLILLFLEAVFVLYLSESGHREGVLTTACG